MKGKLSVFKPLLCASLLLGAPTYLQAQESTFDEAAIQEIIESEVNWDEVPFPINREKVPDEQRVAELRENFWGMFICWSFSTFSGQEWTPTLDKDANYFKATAVDTDEWCRFAKEVGMTHILFLIKHHDGFCLWDTKTTDKKVTNSPLGIDVLTELRKSCDKYGLKLALYYSEGDWNFPDARDGLKRGGKKPEVKQAQLKELLTQFGDIDWWWMDHAVGTAGMGHAETTEFMLSLQPNTFVGYNHGGASGRLALREKKSSSDVRDFNKLLRERAQEKAEKKGQDVEQAIADTHQYLVLQSTYPSFPGQPKGAKWFYSLPEYEDIVHPAQMIYDDVVKAKEVGSIFSINIGPDYDGKIREADQKMLREVAQMLKDNEILPPEAFELPEGVE